MRSKSRHALGHFFAFLLGASSSLGALFGAAYSRLDGWFCYVLIALVVMISSVVFTLYLLRPCRGERGYRAYKGRLVATFALTFVLAALFSYLFLFNTPLYEEKEMLPYFVSYIIFGGLALLACSLSPGFVQDWADDEENVDKATEEH